MKKKVLIYGSKDFASIVKNLVEECGMDFVGYIDDFNSGQHHILGKYEDVKKNYSPDLYEIIIAIGYNNLEARWNVYEKVVGDGYNVPSLVHPAAQLSEKSTVSSGAIVMRGAIVDFNCYLNNLVVVWPGVVINHDSIIGANSFLSPNSTICGFVEIGHSCFIGAGSVIVDHNSIPNNGFVKAGQVFYRK